MSPFVSKAQMRKIAELEKQGKLPKGSFREWASATPNIKALPERKTSTKSNRTRNVKVIK